MNPYIDTKLNDLILKIVQEENFKPIPIGIIIQKVKNISNHYSKNDIYKSVDYLEYKHYLRKNNFNKYILDYIEYPVIENIYIEATISGINKSLNAFASYIDSETNEKKSFFIQHNDLKECLYNDVVLLQPLKKELQYENETPYARVYKLIERSKKQYSGTIISNKLYIDDYRFYLSPRFITKYQLKSNIRVLVNLEEIKNGIAYFSLNKIIGDINSSGTDINAIILDSNFKLNLDSEVKKESEAITFNITEKDKNIRKDITNRQIISIDPKESKDMDDAIYVKKMPNNNFFLSVNIADVAYYVHQNSIIDKDAYSKATSVYLVDRVLPMLHHNLSNDICSLNPDCKRFCITVDMEIDNKGELVDMNIFPSIIENKDRLSYDVVNEYFKNKDINLSNKTKEVLDAGFELYKILRSKKYSDGYVELDIKEPKILLNPDGTVKEIIIRESGDAQRMIEDFMVIANHAVTIIANTNDLPFIYRIHDKPDFTKLTKLKIELVKLGLLGQELISETSTDNLVFKKLIELNQNSTKFDLLNKLILKSMSKAIYSTNNVGHFGLALSDYTHFTSPIRRYVDLIIHRIFWMYLFDKDSYTSEDRKYIVDHIDEIADQCTKQEIESVTLERDVNAYKFAEYCESQIGKIFEAQISSINSFGFFVELPNTIEGLVSIKSLEGFWVYDESSQIIHLKNDKEKFYTLGMNVKVKLISADKKTRKIDFNIVE